MVQAFAGLLPRRCQFDYHAEGIQRFQKGLRDHIPRKNPRALANPVGIYFVSEDIFTMASCYQDTLHDWGMFPDHWSVLLDNISEESLLLTGERSDA